MSQLFVGFWAQLIAQNFICNSLRKILDNTPISGNNVEFAVIPAKFRENLDEK